MHGMVNPVPVAQHDRFNAMPMVSYRVGLAADVHIISIDLKTFGKPPGGEPVIVLVPFIDRYLRTVLIAT